MWPSIDTANQVRSIDEQLAVAQRDQDAEATVVPAALQAIKTDEQIKSFQGFFLKFTITNPDGKLDTGPAGVINNNPDLLPSAVKDAIQLEPDGTVLIDSDS